MSFKFPNRTWLSVAVATMALVAATSGFAQDAKPAPKLDTGDTAWMLTSTALVLMMTIPGLALFYAGMVRKKNILATAMQSFAICCLVSILWMIFGYSLVFDDSGATQAYTGGLGKMMFAGVTNETTNSLAGTIP